MERLGAFAMADAEVIESREQVKAIAVTCAPGDPLGEHRRGSLLPGGLRQPHGGGQERGRNAADCTLGIVSATSTKPLGYV